MTSAFEKYPFLKELGIEEENPGYFNGKWGPKGKDVTSYSPIDNEPIASFSICTREQYDSCVEAMQKAQKEWGATPAPVRGAVVRDIANALREKKEALGKLVALEMGKIVAEGIGEVVEFIDIADYAVGLSRMFGGRVVESERKGHFMMEHFVPLGPIGIISAFNFPVAVSGWNQAIAYICGDTCLWKGATSVGLTTIAVTKIIEAALKKNNIPEGVCGMVLGPGGTVGEYLINDTRLKLVSFTGSTAVGKRVSTVVHSEFRRAILECGGNNAVVLMEDANLELAVRGCLFAAVGTAGQRCTTLRRILIHESLFDEFAKRFVKAYGSIKIGSSLDDDTLCGPLHTKDAVKEFETAMKRHQEQGSKVLYGGKVLTEMKGNYVMPTILESKHDQPDVMLEYFVPIVHLIKIKDIDDAIAVNNEVPQGLSSSLFTNKIEYLYQWVGPNGSDCGIVNCNIPTSGAEIGLGFGGEKDTGGGREAGSDSWKQYVKRSSITINYSGELPLAQGINFG